MTYSPIVIFTYNRLDCLKKTVKSLQKNYLASKSRLYIFSDGPKDDEMAKFVQEVRLYLTSITGFLDIQIIHRKNNYGLASNIIDGVTYVVNKHGKVIVLEDDLVTGKYFLQFMNDGLNVYKNEPKVIQIHGYGYLNDKSVPETYFIKTADNLGWATWKRGWDLFEKDGESLLNKINNKQLGSQFDRDGSYPFTKMLESQSSGKISSWAIRWYASAFLNNKYTLYPKHSLVLHVGDDERATNYKRQQTKNDPLTVDLYQGEIKVVKCDIDEIKEIGILYNIFLKKYIPSFYNRLVNKLLYFSVILLKKEKHLND